MSTEVVSVASSAADARAVDAVRHHHSEIAGRVAVLTEALIDAAAAGTDVDAARRAAVDYLTGTLLPHAVAEERTLYAAAGRRADARPLVESMIAVHRILAALVERIGSEPSPVRLAAAAHTLRVVLDAHLVDENDRILPMVAADPDTSLAGILDGMHELLGHHAPETRPEPGASAADTVPTAATGGHTCACGGHDDPVPVLDVREIPHAIRHATVFGAFDAVPEDGALILIAPHDPVPLLRQLADRSGGRLGVDYEQRGPDAWRLRLVRRRPDRSGD